jgi:lantibiotic modifying enzyme
MINALPEVLTREVKKTTVAISLKGRTDVSPNSITLDAESKKKSIETYIPAITKSFDDSIKLCQEQKEKLSQQIAKFEEIEQKAKAKKDEVLNQCQIQLGILDTSLEFLK